MFGVSYIDNLNDSKRLSIINRHNSNIQYVQSLIVEKIIKFSLN